MDLITALRYREHNTQHSRHTTTQYAVTTLSE